MKVIVGLGNPGPEYQGTRHNIGERVVHSWAVKHGLAFRSERGVEASLAKGEVRGVDVIAAVPKTFMNESGRSLSRLLKFVDAPLEALLVVHGNSN